MKCPKCAYVSHDYLDACRKCSIDLVSFKQGIGLSVMQPGELDLVAVVGVGSLNGSDGEFDVGSDFLGTQMLVETEEIEQGTEEEVDIRLDDDIASAESESPKAPGALTRQFFVPDELRGKADEDADIADDDETTQHQSGDTAELHRMMQDPVTEEILNLDFSEDAASSETFFAESVTEESTDVIDMNELQALRDSFSQPESASTEIDDLMHDDQTADVEPDSELEGLSEPDVGQEASLQIEVPEDFDAPVSESLDLNETFIDEQLTTMDAEMGASQPDPGSAQSQDPAAEAAVEADELATEALQENDYDTSGSIQLPDDFQLEDDQAEDLMQEEEADILDLPDQQDVSSTAAAESASDHAQPQAEVSEQSEQSEQPEVKITLSLPIDPNTETLFFDELSETSVPESGLAPESAEAETSQDMSDIPVSDAQEQEATPAPIPLDDLASELLTNELTEAESALELDLELEPPTREHQIGSVTADRPADAQESEATEEKKQS